MKAIRTLGIFSAAVLGTVSLAACSTDGAGQSGNAQKVSLVSANGWEEGTAVSELWKAVLEDKGYEVELTFLDAGPLYQGLADGDFDVFLDAWLPVTHEDYVDRYGDSLTYLGPWNDEASLTIAVNEDAPIDSLEELAENAGLFSNQIIGIESGAGLTSITQDAVIPGYGLENMDFVVSSTPAMLAELKAATDAGDNVVVTLWRPHWAYDAFPVKDLQDPQGLLGAAETMGVIANNSFVETHPEVTAWLENFEMSSQQLYSLENALFNENSDPSKYTEITRKWMDDNPEYIASLTAS